MIQKMYENNYIVYGMIGICIIGLFVQMITNIIYRRLVRASSNISSSKNKLVKEMKFKFETFYKLKIGVNNVDIFVDKHVYNYKACGLLLSTWDSLSGLLMMISLAITPIALVLSIIEKCGETNHLYTLLTGLCTSSILVIVDKFLNTKAKRQRIKINSMDYFENCLKIRLEQEAQDPEAFLEYRAEIACGQEQKKSRRKEKKELKRQQKEQKKQEKILAAEAKQREKEQKRQEKIAMKEAEISRREEEKRAALEQKRKIQEAKEEEKRKALEAKKERQEQKNFERQQVAKLVQMVEEDKKERINQENAKLPKNDLRGINEDASQESKVHTEIAVTKEMKKSNAKQTKIQQRNERLKEEVQAQREQRERDRKAGKDPFETYARAKMGEMPRVKQATKDYTVDDFNMEYEMKVKAIQREEAKRQEAIRSNREQRNQHINKEQEVPVAVMEREQRKNQSRKCKITEK